MTLQGAIQQLHDLRSDGNFPCYYKPSIDKVIETLQMDVQEVRHGYWININDDRSAFKCSVCGEISCCNSPFCGECGAQMNGEEK